MSKPRRWTRRGGAGQGLRGMAERVALLGGHVEFGDADGGGFRVYAHLPLPGERP